MYKRLHILLLVAFAAAGLALPAAARAGDTGGAAAPDASSPTVAPTGGIVGRVLALRGTAQPGAGVVVEVLDSAGGWNAVARSVASPNGVWIARLRPPHIGRFSVRAVLESGSQASAANVSHPAELTVYRAARATWYGPGFYGRRTACGIRMSRTVVGVAHRTLPCGTQVSLMHHGRTIVVPVIDRGPFANAASWDLTAATARQLGMRTTSRIGALALR